MQKFKGLETDACPFANLPEKRRAAAVGADRCQDGGLPVADAGAGGSN
jgi:hypothetical protein